MRYVLYATNLNESYHPSKYRKKFFFNDCNKLYKKSVQFIFRITLLTNKRMFLKKCIKISKPFLFLFKGKE